MDQEAGMNNSKGQMQEDFEHWIEDQPEEIKILLQLHVSFNSTRNISMHLGEPLRKEL